MKCENDLTEKHEGLTELSSWVLISPVLYSYGRIRSSIRVDSQEIERNPIPSILGKKLPSEITRIQGMGEGEPSANYKIRLLRG